jgi:hypothetical protein
MVEIVEHGFFLHNHKYVVYISFWWTNSKKLKYQHLPWPEKKSENDLKEEKKGVRFKKYKPLFYFLLAHLPFKGCAQE